MHGTGCISLQMNCACCSQYIPLVNLPRDLTFLYNSSAFLCNIFERFMFHPLVQMCRP